jgi:hypothetical protein
MTTLAMTNMAMSCAAVWSTTPAMVIKEPQKMAGRLPSRSAIMPDANRPKKDPINIEAVFKPLVALVRLK